MESAPTTRAAAASPGAELVAIVLAGGRSSRLGGRPKAALYFEGQTLLERTLDAMVDARKVVIVGETSLVARAANLQPGSRLLVTQEKPPFAGPAAAVAAGVDALVAAQVPPSALALVLACDMPHVVSAAHALVTAAADLLDEQHDGVMAVDDDGRAQFLTAVYRFGALVEAVALARAAGPLDNLSAKRLFAPLAVTQVRVPPGSTRDVDTVTDAESFGIELPTATTTGAATASAATTTPGTPTAALTTFDTTGSRL